MAESPHIPEDLTDALTRMRDVQSLQMDPASEVDFSDSAPGIEIPVLSVEGNGSAVARNGHASAQEVETLEPGITLSGVDLSQTSPYAPTAITRKIYKDFVTELPVNWSSKLVGCAHSELNVDQEFPDIGVPDLAGVRLSERRETHEVLFIWSGPDDLFVFDAADSSLSGPEIEQRYEEWEVRPSDFGRFLTGTVRYPDRGARSRRFFWR